MVIIVARLKREINIPEGVQLELENHTYKFKGPKGESQRKFFSPNVKITKQENKIILEPNAKKPSKREKTMINTFTAHINNLIKGVQEGYLYKLKICSGHFPMTVTVDKNKVIIKNFLGEKVPRKARILEETTVKIDGEIITVEGTDIEKTGQTAVNIEKATVIKGRDKRRFQDGIYLTNKHGKPI